MSWRSTCAGAFDSSVHIREESAKGEYSCTFGDDGCICDCLGFQIVAWLIYVLPTGTYVALAFCMDNDIGGTVSNSVGWPMTTVRLA